VPVFARFANAYSIYLSLALKKYKVCKKQARPYLFRLFTWGGYRKADEIVKVEIIGRNGKKVNDYFSREEAETIGVPFTSISTGQFIDASTWVTTENALRTENGYKNKRQNHVVVR